MTKTQEKIKRYLGHQKLEGKREEQVRLYNFFKSDLKNWQKLGKSVLKKRWLKRKQKPGGRHRKLSGTCKALTNKGISSLSTLNSALASLLSKLTRLKGSYAK